MKRKVSFVCASLLVFGIIGIANATTIVVHSKANIYGAGHSTSPVPGGGYGGILPPSYSFLAAPNQVLLFSDISGSVSYNGGAHWWGPDGYGARGNCQPYGGLSAINNFSRQALIGVFLDDTEPVNPAPAPLNFDYTALTDGFSELYPEKNQLFFIGDGLTGTGSGEVQTFHVPDVATRLFLGFLDFDDFSFYAHYIDNVGSHTATFEINTQPVPEPTTILLSGLGLLGMGAYIT